MISNIYGCGRGGEGRGGELAGEGSWEGSWEGRGAGRGGELGGWGGELGGEGRGAGWGGEGSWVGRGAGWGGELGGEGGWVVKFYLPVTLLYRQFPFSTYITCKQWYSLLKAKNHFRYSIELASDAFHGVYRPRVKLIFTPRQYFFIYFKFFVIIFKIEST